MKQFFRSATLLVATVVIAFGAYSCSTTPIDKTKLSGHWVLEEVNGKSVKEFKGATPTMEFDFNENRVSGSSGCNTYGGAFMLDDKNVFSAPNMISTMMACMDMEIEDVFTEALRTKDMVLSLDDAGVLKFSKDGKALLVFKHGEKIANGFVAVTDETLAGDWKLESMGDADVTKLFGDRLPTLTFAEEGKVFGFAGCNRLNGSYTLEGDKLTILRPATTMMACDHLEGEGLFVKTLDSSFTPTIVGNRLAFAAESGIVVLSFERTVLEKK